MNVQKTSKKNIILVKKRHTIKAQLTICAISHNILSIYVDKGSVHDFRIFKKSKLKTDVNTKILVDSGYQGIQKIHNNVEIPIKNTKKHKLTTDDKSFNKNLSKRRIFIENINRKCKIFRIVKEVYRGKHKNYGLVWHVIGALVNLRYSEA